MNYNKQDLGETIKTLRKLHNISQEKLADRAELSQQQISRIELGLNTPKLETLIKLSKALRVSIEVIINTNNKGMDRGDLMILEKIKLLNEGNRTTVLGYIDALLDRRI